MNSNAYTMQSWDEHIVSGPEDGPRYAHARATFAYTGLIEGTSICDYLLYYHEASHDGAHQLAPGFERIEGSVHGRAGSFLVRHDVAYGAHGIEDSFTVIPGSATGELAGLSGHGTAASATETVPYTFEFRFD